MVSGVAFEAFKELVGSLGIEVEGEEIFGLGGGFEGFEAEIF